METMNYQKVTMRDNSSHIVSHYKMPKSGMKNFHILKIGINGIEYIINTYNNRAYKAF